MAEERTARMSSVLGETSIVIGNVAGVGDLEVRGRVQGSLSLNGRVLIAETGVVLGNVEATHIAVAGEVRGDLSAKDGVEVQAQGRVEGNVEAPRVGIEAGARVRGMLRTGGELPSPKTAQVTPAETPTQAETLENSGMSANPSSAAPAAPGAPPRPPASEATAVAGHTSEERNRNIEGNRNVERNRSEERKEPNAHARRRPEFTPPNFDRTRKLKPARNAEDPRLPEDKPKKAQRKKGAPPPPTFIKGARGRAK